MTDSLDLRTEVFNVCDSLQRSCQQISSTRVRGVIGRGSFTTIKSHIDAWRALHLGRQQQEPQNVGEGAPSSWMHQANELWKNAYNEGLRTAASKITELESTVSQLTQIASKNSDHRVAELELTIKRLEEKAEEKEASHRAEMKDLFDKYQQQIHKSVETIEGVQHHLLLASDNEKQAQLSNLRSINALLSKEIEELRIKLRKSLMTSISEDGFLNVSNDIDLKSEMLRITSGIERIHVSDLKDQLVHHVEDTTDECESPMELVTTSIAKWLDEGVIFKQDNFISLVR